MEPEQDRFLEALFGGYYYDLLSYARVCLGSSDLAEDMVQDTFHEATNQVDRLLEHPYPSRWLMKTLKFKICNYTRIQKRHRKYLVECLDLRVFPSEESVEQLVLMKEEQPLFQRLRKVLEEEEISFLVDATLKNYSHSQLAEKYGLTVWASAKRLSRIRGKLLVGFPEHRQRKNR